MAMLAADAARVLDDRGIASAHVVGLSMGAGVALELAIRMPHRVRSLVLVGGGAGGPSTARPGVRAAAGTVATVLSDSVRHRHAWPAAALFSTRFRIEHPDEVSAYMPYFARHRAPVWMTGWQALAVACFGRRASLPRVRAPTLVLHGGAGRDGSGRERQAARRRDPGRRAARHPRRRPRGPARASHGIRPAARSSGSGATRASSRPRLGASNSSASASRVRSPCPRARCATPATPPRRSRKWWTPTRRAGMIRR